MSGTSNTVALLVTRAGWVGGAPCWEAHALLEPEVERFWRVLGCRCCAVGFCEEPVLQGAGALGALGSVLGLGPPLCPVQPIAGPGLPGLTAARCQLCLCAPPASPVLLSLFMA